MSAPTTSPSRRRARALAAACLTLTTVIAGCDIRVDQADPIPAAPTSEERARQETARQAQELIELASAVSTDDAELAVVVSRIEAASTTHLESLGEVWEPWPGSGPEATAYPDEENAAPAPAPGSVEPANLLEVLRGHGLAARLAAAENPGDDLGLLLASVSVSRSLYVAALAEALGEASESETSLVWADPSLPESLDEEAADAADAGRAVYELIGARGSGESRSESLTRATDLERIARAAGAPHEVVRDLSAAGGPQAASRDLAALAEHDLTVALIGTIGRGTDIADASMVLVAATDAALRAQELGTEFPDLPGIERATIPAAGSGT